MIIKYKASHNVAQITFDEFVSLMKNILPKENMLSGFFYDSKKLTNMIGMRVEKKMSQ